METYWLQRSLPQPISVEAFRPYGQLILASSDGQAYGPHDAQLQLEAGIPRFYIMRLENRGRKFHSITRHLRCTQCLGSLEGRVWFLGVAAPTEAPAPRWEDIQIFQIPGNCFVKLEAGTWHAGPYFDESWVDFYNLELSDTNVTDHYSCNLLETYGVEFEIVNQLEDEELPL